eukprot:TRINITY_DN5339_c0_g1_i1.p1 TRINITY_DN5339_c0_g1~~TRINITY_DN5339_c0_g1_i1.p1  ORF type:complete len:402 (+),score=96.77 TRINITY_DN5339_c0_g1_i1:113-1318(+)
MKSTLFITLLFCILATWATDSEEIFRQCFSDMCVVGHTQECYEFDFSLEYDGISLFQRGFSIDDILSQVDTDFDERCIVWEKALMLPGCVVCGNLKDVSYESNALNYCGTVSINCTEGTGLPDGYIEEIDFGCQTLEGCNFLGCPNDCSSHGSCNKIGACICEENFYGPDCSIEVTENSLQAPFLLGGEKIRWDFRIEECDYVDIRIKAGSLTLLNKIHQKISDIDPIPLGDCIEFEDIGDCNVCFSLEDFDVEGSSFHGCINTEIECLGASVASYHTCFPLITSDNIECEESDTEDDNGISEDEEDSEDVEGSEGMEGSEDNSGDADNEDDIDDKKFDKITKILLAAILGACLIAVIIYGALKYKGKNMVDVYNTLVQTNDDVDSIDAHMLNFDSMSDDL